MVEVCTIVEVFIRCQGLEFGDVFVRFKLELSIDVVVVAYGEIGTFNEAAELAQTSFDLVAVTSHFKILKVDRARRDRNAVATPVIGVTE